MIFEASARRYDELIQKLIGSAGSGPDFAPPGFVWEVDRPEWAALKRERWWTTGVVTQIGDATHFAQVEILNPAGSTLLTVITRVLVFAPNASTNYILILDGTASGGAPVRPLPLDTRIPTITTQASGGKPDLAIGAQQQLEIAATGSASTVDNNLDFRLPQRPGVILSPGHRMKVECGTVNVTINVALSGYERPATPDELANL